MAQLTQTRSEPTVTWHNTRQLLLGWGGLVAGLLILFGLATLFPLLDSFPETWNLGLREVLNQFKRWVVVKRLFQH